MTRRRSAAVPSRYGHRRARRARGVSRCCGREMTGFVAVGRSAGPALAGLVESYWYARGTIDHGRELIAPTGSVVAAFVFGSPIEQTTRAGRGETFVARTGFVIGPHDQPIMNRPWAETHALGMVLCPAACRRVLGVAPTLLRGRVAGLEAVTPHLAVHHPRLAALAAASPEAALDDVDRILTTGLGAPDPADDRVNHAITCIEADPTRQIGDIAIEVGTSHTRLDHEFRRVVGLSPRVLARILRLRRLLDGLDAFGDTVRWAELAASLGWYDQSHLIRDFRRHTGVTPTRYLLAHREHFDPNEAAPGFVPGDI